MGNAIISTGASGQLATIERQLYADVARVRELIRAERPAIPRALERVANLDVAALTATLVMLRQEAGDDELQMQLAVLVGSFPNAPKTDLEIFGRALIMEIADTNPSRGSLMRACRRLRRTSKFLPTICEVLETIAAEEREFRDIQHIIKELPATIAYKRREHMQWREAKIVDCFTVLEAHGRNRGRQQLIDRDPEIIAEAQALLACGAWAQRDGYGGCKWYASGKLIRDNGKMVDQKEEASFPFSERKRGSRLP
jgi:hypothetical protein